RFAVQIGCELYSVQISPAPSILVGSNSEFLLRSTKSLCASSGSSLEREGIEEDIDESNVCLSSYFVAAMSCSSRTQKVEPELLSQRTRARVFCNRCVRLVGP